VFVSRNKITYLPNYQITAVSAPRWYFQSRRKISPFFALFAPPVVSSSLLEEVIGQRFAQVLVLYEDGCYQFFLDSPSQERIAASLFERVSREPLFIRKLTEEVKQEGQKLLGIARRFLDGDLESRPSSALRRIFHRYREAYSRMFARGVSAVLVDRPLITHLQSVLAQKVQREGDPFSEVFTALSTSPDVNWHLKEEEELRSIARRALKDEQFARAVASGSMSREGLAVFPETSAALERHTERFGWLPHDYEASSWTPSEIADRFFEFAASAKSAARVQTIRTRVAKIKHSQQFLIDRFKIEPQDAGLFEALRHCVYLKHFRKNFDVRACLGLDAFFAVLQHRSTLSHEALLALSPEEVEQLLDGATFSEAELLARRGRSAFLTEDGATSIFTGSQTDPWFAQASVDQDIADTNMVRGLTACPGRAEGPTRLVLDLAGLKKITQGDVMIVMDVLPEYLSVLRRCSALIADGGATITSHVATIAREVGLPALVGALNASKIFKEGALVEVNATEGWARALNA